MKTIKLIELNGNKTLIALDKIVRVSTQPSTFQNGNCSIIHTMAIGTSSDEIKVQEGLDEIEALMGLQH